MLRRCTMVLSVLVLAAMAFADFSTSIPQLGTAVNNRIAVLSALPAPTKAEKRELKKLQAAVEALPFFPNSGQLRDLLAFAGIGKPLIASRSPDTAIKDAVLDVAQCILDFVQNEVSDANAAALLLSDPKYVAKMDKALAKADKALAAAQATFNQNPGAAVALLIDAAVAYRKIRNKAQELDELETLAGM